MSELDQLNEVQQRTLQATEATKSYISSKTLWLNVIAIGAMLIQEQTGFVIGPDLQLQILAAGNMVLRFFTSKKLGK